MVDTSALVAVLRGEPEAKYFSRIIYAADRAIIGAPTRFEFFMVATRLGQEPGDQEARHLLLRIGVEEVAWTTQHADLAFQAFTRFGKGHHPAKLNFGDCMAYALAKSLDAPLLFKGTDFAATDVRRIEG